MSDKNYQELYTKARKIYEAAATCYKELLHHKDVLEKDQLVAAKAAIEKAKLKCLALKKKAQAQVPVLTNKSTDPIKVTIVQGETTPSGAGNFITLSGKQTIQIKYRIENISCPSGLSIGDPCKIVTTNQEFSLQITANGAPIDLSKNITAKLLQVEFESAEQKTKNVVEYTVVMTLPNVAVERVYSFAFNCKGENGVGMSTNLNYHVSAGPSTPLEKPKESEAYPVKITIDSSTPSDGETFYFDKQKKPLGKSEFVFKATIENIIPPASDNNVEISLFSINNRTNDKTTYDLSKGEIVAISGNSVSVTATIKLDNTMEPKEEHTVVLSCKNEKGYVGSKKLIFFTHGKLCYDIIVTDGGYEPVYITVGKQKIITGYTAKRVIEKRYYDDCSKGGNIKYNNAYEQNTGNLTSPEKPTNLGSGKGIPNNVKRPCDFTYAQEYFAKDENKNASNFDVKPLVWVVNTDNTVNNPGKPDISTVNAPLAQVQFKQGVAEFQAGAAAALRGAAARVRANTRVPGPWEILETKQVTDPLGNKVTIQTSEQTVVTTTRTVDVALFTSVKGWGGNPPIMANRMNLIMAELGGVTARPRPTGGVVNGVIWEASDAQRNGNPNLVVLTIITTTIQSVNTRTTVTVPPMGPECP